MKRNRPMLKKILGAAAGLALLASAALATVIEADSIVGPGGGTVSYNGSLNQFGTTTPAHVGTAQTTPPALTSCGTSPAITGTDTAGIVTMGTASPTGCVITFNVAYTGTPYC